MSLIESLIPTDGSDTPHSFGPPAASAIPKPSDITFRPLPVPCAEEEEHNSRLLVIRQSSRFRINGQMFHLIVWCRPTDDFDKDIDSLPELSDLAPGDVIDARQGRMRGHTEQSCVLIQWKVVRENATLGAMCDVLVREYERNRDRPLQLYTPVVKFASAFCQIVRGVPGISWVDNYQSRVIHLDELCVAVSHQLMRIRREREALTESWSQYSHQHITGHAAVPEQWIYCSDIVHIAADASFSRHSGGATGFVSSLGDFAAQPAAGKSILCCELLAIQRAIEYARKVPGRVVIWSDSRLALNHIARMDTGPLPALRPAAASTLDAIKHLLAQRAQANKGPMSFRWIKAHTDCSSLQRILNDGADRLARHTMRNVCDGEFTPTLAGICETIVADCMSNLAALDPSTAFTICTAEQANDDYDGDHDIDSCS